MNESHAAEPTWGALTRWDGETCKSLGNYSMVFQVRSGACCYGKHWLRRHNLVYDVLPQGFGIKNHAN